HFKKMVPSYTLPNTIKFCDLLKADPNGYTRPDVNLSDLAFLPYTGGTTGVSKGAMLSHGNMVGILEQVSGCLDKVLDRG
ncbi:AMP-binding protein, partial [Psychrobacter sp. SIMBA_152]